MPWKVISPPLGERWERWKRRGRPGQGAEGAVVGRVAVLKRVVPEGHRRVWEETRTYPREVEATRGFWPNALN